MDASRVAVLRELLSSTGWVERTRDFARSLRTSTRAEGGLLLVGTPEEEPWHLAAHLDDESRWSGVPELRPTLVRWAPPPNAPAHLSVTLDRIERTQRGETVFVVAPQVAPAPLLERVSDARKVGATVLAIDAGDSELEGLAHEWITVPESGLAVPTGLVDAGTRELSSPAVSFDSVQHLVSVAAGEPVVSAPGRRSLRDRLAHVLDTISGPSVRRD